VVPQKEDIYLVRSERMFISCGVIPGIIDHNGVFLEVDWAEYCHGAQVGREILLYHKTYPRFTGFS
jgi:hypothetical protein